MRSPSPAPRYALPAASRASSSASVAAVRRRRGRCTTPPRPRSDAAVGQRDASSAVRPPRTTTPPRPASQRAQPPSPRGRQSNRAAARPKQRHQQTRAARSPEACHTQRQRAQSVHAKRQSNPTQAIAQPLDTARNATVATAVSTTTAARGPGVRRGSRPCREREQRVPSQMIAMSTAIARCQPTDVAVVRHQRPPSRGKRKKKKEERKKEKKKEKKEKKKTNKTTNAQHTRAKTKNRNAEIIDQRSLAASRIRARTPPDQIGLGRPPATPAVTTKSPDRAIQDAGPDPSGRSQRRVFSSAHAPAPTKGVRGSDPLGGRQRTYDERTDTRGWAMAAGWRVATGRLLPGHRAGVCRLLRVHHARGSTDPRLQPAARRLAEQHRLHAEPAGLPGTSAPLRQLHPVLDVLGAGLALYGLGNVYWTVYIRPLTPEPFPSPADGLWLSFYGFAFVALLLLVRRDRQPAADQPLAGRHRRRPRRRRGDGRRRRAGAVRHRRQPARRGHHPRLPAARRGAAAHRDGRAGPVPLAPAGRPVVPRWPG